MEIRFESLKEIKEFILMVDIYQLCDKQEEWGGLGYIITERDLLGESNRERIITNPVESRVSPPGGDNIIMTPYAKQISWLFKTLYQFVSYNKELDSETFLTEFRVGCEGYFIINPDHTVKELMLFILDGLIRMAEAKHAQPTVLK